MVPAVPIGQSEPRGGTHIQHPQTSLPHSQIDTHTHTHIQIYAGFRSKRLVFSDFILLVSFYYLLGNLYKWLGRTANEKEPPRGFFFTLLTSKKFRYILFDKRGALRSTAGGAATCTSQNNCLELYLSTNDNLVSSMVRVIKWHINIKAYNTVTLSFIASINPQRQTFHPPSVQIVFLHCQVVPNELSPRTYASAHSFIFPSRLIWQLSSNFVSSKAVIMLNLISISSLIWSAETQILCCISH